MRLSAKARENIAGWLFVAPVILILGLFMLLPILMAMWVSVTDWNGQGSPFKSSVPFVGLDNYTKLFAEDGLTRQDFMTSVRNNIYYVGIVVPIADDPRAGPGAGGELADAEGQDLLPRRVLLPVGDQLGRDQRGVPVHLRQLRRGQQPAGVLRASRARSGSPTPAASCTSRSTPSAW